MFRSNTRLYSALRTAESQLTVTSARWRGYSRALTGRTGQRDFRSPITPRRHRKTGGRWRRRHRHRKTLAPIRHAGSRRRWTRRCQPCARSTTTCSLSWACSSGTTSRSSPTTRPWPTTVGDRAMPLGRPPTRGCCAACWPTSSSARATPSSDSSPSLRSSRGTNRETSRSAASSCARSSPRSPPTTGSQSAAPTCARCSRSWRASTDRFPISSTTRSSATVAPPSGRWAA